MLSFSPSRFPDRSRAGRVSSLLARMLAGLLGAAFLRWEKRRRWRNIGTTRQMSRKPDDPSFPCSLLEKWDKSRLGGIVPPHVFGRWRLEWRAGARWGPAHLSRKMAAPFRMIAGAGIESAGL